MKKSLTIVLSGEAGQGLQTIEELLVEAIGKSYYVFSTKEVMSRVRGGNNSVEIRVSEEPVYSFKDSIDLLFLLNDHSLYRLEKRIHEGTTILGEESFVEESLLKNQKSRFESFHLAQLAKEVGSTLFSNTILFGFIAGMLNLDKDSCYTQIKQRFKEKKESIIDDNIKAFDVGFDRGVSFPVKEKIKQSNKAGAYKICDGTSAVGIGALAGGCNFIASYPMSPGTGVLTYLSQKSKEFDILVEQAEDEIAALNMVLGSWYAGARGIVTTSGGGFALMEEAVSLSGVTETPCVIHIAQRPGPGTGLPTRTEQGDLNLAVYAGHGEFPRIVYAPGKLEDAVLLSQKAFYLADKYQVPVMLLTDQFLLESLGQMERLKLEDTYLESFITKTSSDYKRYAYTPDGISPRGIPGCGEGLIKVDSDEHDEYGLITEDFDVRVKMHEKRLNKEKVLLQEYTEPELIGNLSYKKLIVGWGSTYGVLREFIESNECPDTAFLYVKQVFPLSSHLKDYFNQADRIISVENNATGQFADILKLQLNVSVDYQILKYNGQPFSIEEIEEKLEEVL